MRNENIKEKNDKEIREHAKLIMREIVYGRQIEFPAFVQFQESEYGELYFYLNISSELYGDFQTTYRPLKAIESLIKAFIFSKFPDKKSEFHLEGFSTNNISLDVILKTRGATLILLKNFPFEFKEVFEIQHSLAEYSLTFGKSSALEFKHTKQKGSFTKIVKEIDELMQEFSADRKKRFLDEFESRLDLLKPAAENFAVCYEINHKKWEEAKKYYKQNQSCKLPLEMVKTKFSDLDEDLIERFKDPDTYVSMPSKIALFHTARELRMSEATASQKTLENILTKSRKVLESLSKNEIENDENSYSFFDLDSMQKMDLSQIIKGLFNNSLTEE